MKVPPHVIGLYARAARRYKKLISKIQREPTASYQRKAFIHELKKLVRRLRELQLQLKIATATGTVVLLLNASPAQCQNTYGPFVKHDRLTNPLREPIYNDYRSALTAVDFDKDGDVDVIFGEYDYSGGYLRYFKNVASSSGPLYVELKDKENPFNGIKSTTRGCAPAFADIDKDGDLDLYLAQSGNFVDQTIPPSPNRIIEYYRNNEGAFEKQTVPWNDVTKEGNPFDGVQFGIYVTPVFVDMDLDLDLDVVVGSYQRLGVYPDYTYKSIHYFKNDGIGNFTNTDITLDNNPSSWNNNLTPALADLDADGDLDLVVGNYYDGYLRYYKQDTPGNFIEQFDEWDPVAKTGNPFDEFDLGRGASPAFFDFNKDGRLDLFVADADGYYQDKYSDYVINYYKNSPNGVFTKIDGFENPFDGVGVKGDASPVLMDIDGDTDLDAIIGNKYQDSYWKTDPITGQQIWTTRNSYISQYKQVNGKFNIVKYQESRFRGLEVYGNFAPQFADVDGDNDVDIISGNYNGVVVFFKNAEGIYSREVEDSPFADISAPYYGVAKVVDIDNDNDLDLFLSNYYGEIHYFKNIGTAQNPEYEEQFDVDNPLEVASGRTDWWTPFLNFTDIDHDGDLDLFFYYYDESTLEFYYENTGTAENPVFEQVIHEFFGELSGRTQFAFSDYDKDGDLDLFTGNEDGTVSYLENKNENVTTTVTPTVVLYEAGNPSIFVEPALTLSDTEYDLIVRATVSIKDYQAGEKLAFTPFPGISGTFNASTGVLTFRGKATITDYQTLLRTVTFGIPSDDGGRKKPTKKSTFAKTVNFAVYDVDFTNPDVVSKTFNLFINTPPLIEAVVETTPPGSVKSINLMEITSDVDDNLDPASFAVAKAPTSGAIATIEVISASNVQLHLDYSRVTFRETDFVTIRACDNLGACGENILSIEVNVSEGIVVYNAIAPNSGGDNKFLRITGLPETNKIKIYSRWGDAVFETENYMNAADKNAFKGFGKNGNPLASGTYFYTIEIPGQELISGYLTLKQ